jgi:opacity protein-like surface antigen
MRILHSFVLLAIFSSYTVSAEPMWVVETCKIKKWADGKWETVDASEFKGTELDVSPNSKNPEFLQFKSDGKIYSGKKSCFKDASGGEGQGEGALSAAEKSPDSGISVFAGLGMAFSPKVGVDLSVSGASASSESTADSSLTFGLEARKRFSFFFAGAALEYASIKESSAQEGDTVLSLVVIPGVSFGRGFQVWAGMGAGVSMLSAKGGSSTDGGVTITFPDKDLLTLNLSPRVGFGVDLGSNTLLDLSVSYNMVGSADWVGTASSAGNSVDLTSVLKVSYFAAMLRVGQSF